MSVVRRLPNDLANQIAAGEVVERPASVVKELVENALDAGATKVRVEIETGGVARIRVTDDGSGMDEADARLALERHATSKIASLEDLLQIRSFGFRGEALPSIASVSRFSLRTRVRGVDSGTEVVVTGGGDADVRPTGCATGTHIEVRDLFFNVPARRKFLKATATESAHVGEVVVLAALGAPRVAFTLTRDGRVAREITRAASRQERVQQVISEERLEPCLRERGPLRVEAYLAPPERARAGAVALYVFVNGRPVKDRQLTRAIAQAYGSVLEPGRYPVGVVYIELPPDMVDVNVHPQKAEIRFADARGVLDAVTRELHAALAHAFNLPAFSHAHGWWKPGASQTQAPSAAAPSASLLATTVGAPHLAASPAADPWQLAPPHAEASTAAASSLAYVVAGGLPLPVSEGAPDPLFGRRTFYGQLRFVGQVRAMFLVAEGDDGMYVLDQHAAAERVTFERLRADYKGRRIASQRLLIPEVVTLTPGEHALLEEHADDAMALGLEVRVLSGSSVAVHAVPKIVSRAPPERLVRDLVAEVGRAAQRPFQDAVDLVLATMACHGSVRAGDVLSTEEARALLASLDGAEFAGHCPHGRPVVMRLGWDELERRVGR
jgi:DNA mismatch repair protein MutL